MSVSCNQCMDDYDVVIAIHRIGLCSRIVLADCRVVLMLSFQTTK